MTNKEMLKKGIKIIERIHTMVWKIESGEYLGTKLTRWNYLQIEKECSLLFNKIFANIEFYGLDKSLFLDFMDYETELNYCLAKIFLDELNTAQIHSLLEKEKDYLHYLYLSIRNITPSKYMD
jgi:hypothetical protein